MLYIGRAMEGHERFEIIGEGTRRVLICGKTGFGKSYTLGVILEELIRNESVVSIVIDPQGIFWTMSQSNDGQRDLLFDWDLTPVGFDVNILVPGDPVDRYGGSDIIEAMESRGVRFQSLLLNPSDVSAEMWCDLFGLDINELMGILVFKIARDCRLKLRKDFFIEDMIKEAERSRALEKTKEAVIRKLEMALDWNIFERYRYREIWEIISPSAINVVDLSTLEQARYGLRNLVVGVLARFIFNQRTVARRRESLGLSSSLPRVWLAVDEAQNFCPAGKSALAKEVLIRWAKEGRQPGLSLIVATQQPSAIDKEILTQCGLKIVHRLTAREDRKAINALSEDYLNEVLEGALSQVTKIGEALFIDDDKEHVELVKVHPRMSEHGGGGG
jgi:DNA helicase HerA-like ATPase